MKRHFGKIHVNTGDGHGKTTSALGIAMRAIGHGYKICMIQFMKGRENVGEFMIQKKLKSNFNLYQFGNKDFIINKKLKKSDIEKAKKGFNFAKKTMQEKNCDILILDEINVAVDFNLIKEQTLLEFIENYRNQGVEIILTGRNARKKVIDAADIVTDMKKIKHYYDQGIDAREGIEY